MDAQAQNPTPTRGVAVVLDGKTRHLRYSFKTRRLMMDEFGGEEQFAKGLKGDNIPKILWFGFRHEDPELLVEDVEEMLDMEHLEEVTQAMLKAMGFKGQLEFKPQQVEATKDADPPTPSDSTPSP